MSNIIPMVSASPPPLDEAPSFSDAWGGDDDDGDFGSFTGADSINDTLDFSNCALPSPQMQSIMSKDDAEADRDNSSPENSPRKIPVDGLEFSSSSCESQKKPSTLDLPKCNNYSNGSALPCHKGEFETVEDSKNLHKATEESIQNDISITKSSQSLQESRCNKRESTTDSGMCSTDISPIPISDNTADFCDTKSSCSEADEMFTEVQSDLNLSPEYPSIVLDDSVHKHSMKVGESNAGDVEQCTPDPEEVQSQDLARTFEIECHTESSELDVSNEPAEQSSSHPDDSSTNNVCNDNSVDMVEDNEWPGFSEPPSSVPAESKHCSGKPELNTDVENCNVSESHNSEISDSAPSARDVRNPTGDSQQVDNSQDSDINDNTDSDSGHFIKRGETSEVEDLELPQINDVDDEELSSEIKSESENEQLPSEHSSGSQVDSSPSEDCGTFQTASMGEEGSLAAHSENNFAAFPADGNNSDDDWADFSKTPAEVGPDNAEDFGGFSQNTFTQDKTLKDSTIPDGTSLNSDELQVDDNDDFGDFSFQEFSTGSATTSTGWADTEGFASATETTNTHVKSDTPAVPQDNITKVLSSCFPYDAGGWGKLGSFVQLLDDIIEKTIPSIKLPNTLQLPNQKKSTHGPAKETENIWIHLRDIEKSLSGKYEWSDSSGNKKLFNTLKIDARNVLMFGVKKPGIPLYAANLGLLEPMREDQKSQDVKKVDTLVDTSKTDTSITAVNQDIPPAQFDWSGSGLTNPLDAKSTLLDLDLLAVNEGKTAGENKGRVFESDLLGGAATMKSPPKTLQPLETILAGMKFNPTIKQVKANENLSAEAATIINTLPDLSFMQAKVLMFPLRTGSEGSLTSGGT